jgi:hypothetical protein
LTIQDSWLDNPRQEESVVAANHFRVGTSRHHIAAGQFGAAENGKCCNFENRDREHPERKLGGPVSGRQIE